MADETDRPAPDSERPSGPAAATSAITAPGRAAPKPPPDPIAFLRGLLQRPLASYYLLLSAAALLLLIGLTMVFSATSVESYANSGNSYSSFLRQLLYAGIGLVLFWICQRLPGTTYRQVGRILLVLAFALVIAMDGIALLADWKLLAHPVVGGLRSDGIWLYVGPVQMQPSELAKLALALWCADRLARLGPQASRLRDLTNPVLIVAAAMFMLVGYSDFGTMVCLLILFIGILWAAGVRLQTFAVLSAVAAAGLALLILAPDRSYRWDRLTAFLHPEAANCDQSMCYQATQGRYALAEGGWFGVGLGEGHLKWGLLPNGRNDFIFAIIGEELGVVGCLVVLILLAVLAYSGLRIARRVEDPFRQMVAAGITIWLIGQALINIGGVLGLLPITGLPLPLVSDGGSALVVVLAAIGVLASFARAEPEAARALRARPPARWVRVLWAPLPSLARSTLGRPAPAEPDRPRPAPPARTRRAPATSTPKGQADGIGSADRRSTTGTSRRGSAPRRDPRGRGDRR
jgi:cell division protein FtsW